MNSELLRLIDSISRERNVDAELLLEDLEQAMVSAARKHYEASELEEFVCQVDRQSGQIRVWRENELIDLAEMGRIPAQTAKQVMIQKFREDERSAIYSEFIEREGDLVTGMAQRYEGGALIVQIGRAEGFMPRREQIPGEQHQPGERVRCLIREVAEEGSKVKIRLSRADPDVIRRLFEVEVPEVAERIIEIRAMAREAGHRTKLAVQSTDPKVDAVGACVGVRGSRIKNIVDELGGEKIDIVRWNDSSQILIANALKPAEVVEISLCFELGRATVVVNEDQLSLAIGKRGQNVRLAARLTNWDVDILTPAEYTKSLDIMEETFGNVEGTTEEQFDRLAAMGIISVFDLEEVGPVYLGEELEMDEQTAIRLVNAASEKGKVVAVQQAKDKAENEAARKAAQAGKPLPPKPADDATPAGDGAAAPADADLGPNAEPGSIGEADPPAEALEPVAEVEEADAPTSAEEEAAAEAKADTQANIDAIAADADTHVRPGAAAELPNVEPDKAGTTDALDSAAAAPADAEAQSDDLAGKDVAETILGEGNVHADDEQKADLA